jgi:hypothetical protein
VIFSACCSQRNVVSGVEDHLSLGKHSVVFDLSLTDCGAVVGENDQLGLSVTKAAEGRFVTQNVFSTLDHQTEFAVDVLCAQLFNHNSKFILNNI